MLPLNYFEAYYVYTCTVFVFLCSVQLCLRWSLTTVWTGENFLGKLIHVGQSEGTNNYCSLETGGLRREREGSVDTLYP